MRGGGVIGGGGLRHKSMGESSSDEGAESTPVDAIRRSP